MNRKIFVMIKTNMLEILICVFIFMSLVFCITGDFNHDDLKLFYYRGLKEWSNEKGFLIDTCLTAQDRFKKYLDYFRIPYDD